MIDFLIEKGAAVNHASKSGDTPLHGAVRLGRVKVVESLIKAGAYVNATNIFLNTPLHYVDGVANWSSTLFNLTVDNSLTITKLLINNGACVNVRSISGRTPLDRVNNEKSKNSIYLHKMIEIINQY